MNIGIDYGSKLAGTTVIAYRQNGLVYLTKSVKNQDADEMIIDFVKEHPVKSVGLDAPLSLPGVYTGLVGFDDYHYRRCDKATKAMSPMFLGGLTARAMKLTSRLGKQGVQVYETYPVYTGKELFSNALGYRSKTPDYEAMIDILKIAGLTLANDTNISTSHDLDSILALKATLSIGTDNQKSIGDPQEGLIYY